MHEFEGLPVTECAVALVRTGDGLSEAMQVDPVELHQGDKVFMVIEGQVNRIRFDPASKDDVDGSQKRTHTITARAGTIVPEGDVAALLAAQQERNLKAREAAAGIEPLPFDEEDETG